MTHHEATASDEGGRPGGGSGPHESVSGGQVVGEASADQLAESFEGTSGLLEPVEGFQPVSAIRESMLSEEADVSDFGDVPPIEDLVFQQPESVCGSDERTRISPCTSVPWRWNAKLVITLANGQVGGGTGWFIGPRTVMTAGHCVFSAANGGWVRSVRVIPGMDGSSQPFGSQIGTSFRSVTGWTSNGNAEYDYGAIILPNADLGNAVGWFGFAALSDASLQNLFVNTAGYPGDKPFGTQWYGAGNITQVTARRLFYMVDTFGGQSGSAVWRFLNGVRHAVGVHGYGGCPNGAVRITGEVYNNMMAWRNL